MQSQNGDDVSTVSKQSKGQLDSHESEVLPSNVDTLEMIDVQLEEQESLAKSQLTAF